MAEKRTPAEQLKALDDRLGVGVGAVKERARLNEALGLVGPKKARKRPSKQKRAKFARMGDVVMKEQG